MWRSRVLARLGGVGHQSLHGVHGNALLLARLLGGMQEGGLEGLGIGGLGERRWIAIARVQRLLRVRELVLLLLLLRLWVLCLEGVWLVVLIIVVNASRGEIGRAHV